MSFIFVILTIATNIAILIFVPDFTIMFDSFGADLPQQTVTMLSIYKPIAYLLIVFNSLFLILRILNFNSGIINTRSLNRLISVSFYLTMIFLGFTLSSVYLPIAGLAKMLKKN